MLKLSVPTLFVKKNLRSSVLAWLRYISDQPDRNVPRYSLRYMCEQDIPQVAELRRVNHFDDATSSYSHLLKIDPKCFVVAEAENGLIIATGALRKIVMDTYFFSFHVTHKDYRFRGMANHIIKHLFDSRRNCNILGATEIGMLRRNLNFPHDPYFIQNDFVNIEYEYDTVIDHNLLSSELPQGVFLDEYQDSFLGAILDYDCSVVDYKREQLVTLNCQDKDSRTFVATKGGFCVGYGTIKPTIQGYGKIGPLYAENPAIAEAVLKNLLVSFNVKEGLGAQTLSNNVNANLIFGTFETKRKNVILSYRLYSKELLMSETKKIYAVFEGECEPF
ncbi:uncharacterized protein [Parasteatoda tepidariorum]|uniref:uncharacterized protein isoform X2 n=2 Tax=Parasteatoda tepidariorum TaxID=114398 RepID=UPI001C729C23|nr:uncharacterized protein LOC107450807 [Parasteatoda tepidariorum]